MMIACAHATTKKNGKDRHGNQRFKCVMCGKRWTEERHKPLGEMRVPVESAKLVLHLLVQGSSIRATERVTGINRNTICKLVVRFGDACKRFLDERMRGLTLSHLQFDEQWTWVGRKQSRLTHLERAERHDVGDVYIWTCIDQRTKLMPAPLVARRMKKYDVRSWIDKQECTDSTRRAYATSIKRVISWAVGEGLIERDPIGKLERPAVKRREVLVDPADYVRMLEQADLGRGSQYRRGAFRAFLMALRHSGARPSEVARVTAADFVSEAGVWVLKKHKTARKTARDRVIYLSPCLETMSRILAAARPAGPLFLNSEGQPWTANAIRCRMRRMRDALGLPAGTVAYALRHTYATEGLVNGVGTAEMAELLGHTSTAMLSRHYSHLGQRAAHIRRSAGLAARADSRTPPDSTGHSTNGAGGAS